MLRLVDMARLDRPVRQEDIDDLGKTTQQQLIEAIDEGVDERPGVTVEDSWRRCGGVHDGDVARVDTLVGEGEGERAASWTSADDTDS